MLPLTQIVPSSVCLNCEVCCRFPEYDSFLRPYFTQEEIVLAIDRGIDPIHFPDSEGCQIAVVPHPQGEGYMCPAFDPETSHCRIYDVRPLDCQIYPFTLMWDVEHTAVWLGWDQKCPYVMTEATVGEKGERLTHVAEEYASRIQTRFEKDDQLVRQVLRNPQLVTPFQEDVVVFGKLAKVTEALTA